MIAKMHSCAVRGMDAIVVDVEVDISLGMPVFSMVGLAETAVRESKERVRSAIQNAGYTFPMDRVVVNLAPADVKKEGTGLDLPVALGILGASGLFQQSKAQAWLMAGELSLDGSVKPVRGSISFALAARDNGFRGIILAERNGREASMVRGIDVLGVSHLSDVVDFFSGERDLPPLAPEMLQRKTRVRRDRDFALVRGQDHVKRALEVAAAGGHHILMNGPAGSGKSMMAKCLPGILPGLSFEEQLDIARVYSIAGADLELNARPFRAPHHSISDAGLVGGGPGPMPGEISLAHNGVLFLDEMPEFRRNVLEVLRQPLEDGEITLARARSRATYPCRFMLVGAMNPCPCGNLTNPAAQCTCSAGMVSRYRAKLSGPLVDRMDVQVEVPRLSYDQLSGSGDGDGSERIRHRVEQARQIQTSRFKDAPCHCNAEMGRDLVLVHCRPDSQGERVIGRTMDRLNLSARAYTSVLKLSRTIADLAGEDRILKSHILEAVQYKAFDRDAGMSV